MDNIKESIEILVKAKTDIHELLKDTHSLALIGVDTGLLNLINKLNFISGTTTISAAEQYPPVTDFMGEALTLTKPVIAEDIVPSLDKKQAFLKKVDDLQAQMPTLLNEKILESYVVKEDVLAIRGVAKRAGLKNFATAEITSTYLDEIKEALKQQAAAKAFEDKQDENINKQSMG